MADGHVGAQAVQDGKNDTGLGRPGGPGKKWGAPDEPVLLVWEEYKLCAFRVWPHPTRYYGYSDLHCVTFKLLSPSAVGGRATLEAVRRQYRFVVLGYVVMPEHVHLLVSEPERRDLSVVLKALLR